MVVVLVTYCACKSYIGFTFQYSTITKIMSKCETNAQIPVWQNYVSSNINTACSSWISWEYFYLPALQHSFVCWLVNWNINNFRMDLMTFCTTLHVPERMSPRDFGHHASSSATMRSACTVQSCVIRNVNISIHSDSEYMKQIQYACKDRNKLIFLETSDIRCSLRINLLFSNNQAK